jgi:hypothetical protein
MLQAVMSGTLSCFDHECKKTFATKSAKSGHLAWDHAMEGEPERVHSTSQDRVDETPGRWSRMYLYSCHVSQITTISNSVISKSQMECVKVYL